MFSRHCFDGPVPVGNAIVYLPVDGDILYLCKQHLAELPEVEELLARQPRHIALWKTGAEFEVLFENKDDSQRASVHAKTKELLKELIPAEDLADVMVLPVKPKVAIIHGGQVYIKLGQKILPFTSVIRGRKDDMPTPYFYVFIPRRHRSRAEACVQALVSAKMYK
jgi:hypothetical protein